MAGHNLSQVGAGRVEIGPDASGAATGYRVLGVFFGQDHQRIAGERRLGLRRPAPAGTRPEAGANSRCSIFMDSRITTEAPPAPTLPRVT